MSFRETVRDRVLDTLRRTDGPIDQTTIAMRSGDNFNTVRRVVQELRAAGVIEVADYNTTGYYPRLRLPVAVNEPLSTSDGN